MSDNDTKLVKTGKLGPLKVGMAAKVHAAAKEGGLASQLFNYSNYPNRIILCIDDSGSMRTHMDYNTTRSSEDTHDDRKSCMLICRQACEEFLNVCDSRDTALGLYTISTGKEFKLSTNYVHLLGEIRQLQDSGGTPTIATLDKIQEKENVNRVVIVSDGESGAIERNYDHTYSDYDGEGGKPESKYKFTTRSLEVLNKYKDKKTLIDTVFIGDTGSNGEREMQMIAEYTGGLFLVFKSGESFRTKFKYLAPAFRGMLTSGQVKL